MRTRTLAVVFAGFCAFLQIYSTQPLLPLFTQIFHAGKLAVSMTLTVAGLGVALAAPAAGILADRLGRKRVIVWSALLLGLAALATASARSLNELVFWRFWQGVFTPGIFAVTIAYINDEWPPGRVGGAISGYVGGTVMGGFASRMIAGFIAEHAAWQMVFVVLGAFSLAGAGALAAWLPDERNFLRLARVAGSSWLMDCKEHFRNPQLLAAFSVGFCLLFSLVAAFTYVTFYLAAPPFNFGAAALGSIFFVYIVGAGLTSVSGRGIDRFGQRAALAIAVCVGMGGVALTLAHSLWAVALGLAVTCSGVFIAQASASSFIGIATTRNRALAVGLYATFYYVGGSAGAALPVYFWNLGGWPACVALIAGVQVVTVLIAMVFWKAPADLDLVPAELSSPDR